MESNKEGIQLSCWRKSEAARVAGVESSEMRATSPHALGSVIRATMAASHSLLHLWCPFSIIFTSGFFFFCF